MVLVCVPRIEFAHPGFYDDAGLAMAVGSPSTFETSPVSVAASWSRKFHYGYLRGTLWECFSESPTSHCVAVGGNGTPDSAKPFAYRPGRLLTACHLPMGSNRRA